MNAKTLADRFAILIGAFLVVEGVWELFSPVVFGVLTSNTLHGIIHILLGMIGLALGWKARARGFCIFLGILLLVVGALWFVPGANELVVRILNLNKAVALMNLVVGAIALLVSFTSTADRSRTSEL